MIMKRCFMTLLLLFCMMLLKPIGVEAATGNVHAIVICGRDMHKTSAKKIHKALKENKLPVYNTEDSNIKFFSYEVKSSKKHTTRTNFYNALDDAFSTSTTKDLNIVFYTGHGAPDGIPLWMSATNKTKAGITYKDLASKLSKYKGKFVYISNTCFSRAFYTQGVSKVKNGNKRFLVLSAVYQDLESIANIFTDRILKGIGYDSYTSLPADYNKDGMVSVDELYTYTDLKSAVFRPYLDGTGPGKGITIFQFAYVKQTKSRVSVSAGKTVQLKSKVHQSGDRARAVKWKSSNMSIATVNSSGKVTAKKSGTVKITAYLTDSLGQICNGSESVCTVSVKKKKQTKTQYLCTTLVEKTNPAYQFHLSSGVAYKVELKKNEVVIHGSVSKMNKSGTFVISGTVSNIGKHTYKLAKKVKYLSRGGDAPDTKFTKSSFKKCLKTAKNSQLALILEIKNKKVTKIVISS